MEQKMREKKQQVKVSEKAPETIAQSRRDPKAVGGREAKGRIAQELYENDGKQNDLLSKTHQTLITYTVK